MNKVIGIKVSEDEDRTIRAAAKERNMSISAFIRQAVKNQLRNETELAELKAEIQAVKKKQTVAYNREMFNSFLIQEFAKAQMVGSHTYQNYLKTAKDLMSDFLDKGKKNAS